MFVACMIIVQLKVRSEGCRNIAFELDLDVPEFRCPISFLRESNLLYLRSLNYSVDLRSDSLSGYACHCLVMDNLEFPVLYHMRFGKLH